MSNTLANPKKQRHGFYLHPVTMFMFLSLLIVIISHFYQGLKVEFFDAKLGTEKMIVSQSLLSKEGLKFMFNGAITNFVFFAPLGTFLVAMLGVGVADDSGLISTALKKLVLFTPPRLVTSLVILLGVLSNMAGDVGYVVFIPLGAIVFLSFGRHPLAGLFATFAGVSGGYSANVIISTLDKSLTEITNITLKQSAIDFSVSNSSSFYFMLVSTLLIVIIGSLITEKLIEPKLSIYTGPRQIETLEITAKEKKGLIAASLTFVLLLILLAFLTLPSNAFFLGEDSSLKNFINSGGLITFISLLFLIPGLVYGLYAGTIRNDKDLIKMMSHSMGEMGSYLVMVFFAAQFIAYFEYTKLGTIITYNLGDMLNSSNFDGLPLMFTFILLVAFANLFVPSATIKWGILAPLFLPIFYRMGINPDLAQIAFRIGDSSTNILTPLLPYMAVLIVFAQKYESDKEHPITVRRVLSMMFPYSFAFLIGWSIFLALWFYFTIPFGY